MSEGKGTGTHPGAGERIGSTPLAHHVGWSCGLLTTVLLTLLLGAGYARLLGWRFLLPIGVLFFLLSIVLGVLLDLKVEDRIARTQHLRRQRLLQRKLLEEEWRGVPAGALSRAHPPGKPEPTPASLSLADPLEDAPPRLAAGVEAVTAEDEKVLMVQRKSEEA